MMHAIDRPRILFPVPVRLATYAHMERISRDGQRIVYDLFMDAERERIVQRCVNMVTGKVLWFLFDRAARRNVL